MLPRPRLPLRTKMAVLFGLLALITTVSLSVVTYTFARSRVLNQERTEAQARAVANALRVVPLLRADPGELVGEDLPPRQGDGFILVMVDNQPVSVNVRAPEAFPSELGGAVEEGGAGMQRFRFDGGLYLGVGIPLPEVGATYFEAFPLDDAESTLRELLIALAIGSAVTVLLAAGVALWTSQRLLRPLQRIRTAAGRIAAGDLDTRLAAERDPDLVPIVDSFNGMADAVQTRVEREARFASDVSHELRSPITALSAASDVLSARRDDMPQRTRQAVDVMISQVRRFDGMVLDLLELSRIDAGAADLHLETADLAELCLRIARRNGFGELPIVVQSDAAPLVRVDRVRFERILTNLLDNARRHAGGPTRMVIEAAPSPFVDLVVEDAGPGVAPGERERIFERFTRGTESHHGVGTGLGLALVAEHAQALGGASWVEDRLGGGARFVVRLRAGRRRRDEGQDPR